MKTPSKNELMDQLFKFKTEDNLTIKSICSFYYISPSTLRKWRIKYNITLEWDNKQRDKTLGPSLKKLKDKLSQQDEIKLLKMYMANATIDNISAELGIKGNVIYNYIQKKKQSLKTTPVTMKPGVIDSSFESKFVRVGIRGRKDRSRYT